MKELIGTCVGNPFDDMGILANVVDNYAKPITKRTFLKHCAVPKELLKDMARFPYDYEFYRSKAWFK